MGAVTSQEARASRTTTFAVVAGLTVTAAAGVGFWYWTSATSCQQPTTDQSTPYGNTLPETLHVTLRASQGKLKPGRCIIVGDVHGCADELERLLNKELKVDPAVDTVIFVGDLVNKGPYPQRCLDIFRNMGALGCRGNHDDHCLKKWHTWKETGRLPPGSDWIRALSEDDVTTLERLPFSLALPEYGVLVVHAGMVPPPPPTGAWWPKRGLAALQGLLDGQSLHDLLCIRDVVPDDAAPSGWRGLTKGAPGSCAWGALWPGPHHIVFGHDAKRKLQLHLHATGLDTGCVYGGRLSAAVLPPLAELVQTRPAVAAHAASCKYGKPLAALPAITRDDLNMELVSVLAKTAYAPVNNKDG